MHLFRTRIRRLVAAVALVCAAAAAPAAPASASVAGLSKAVDDAILALGTPVTKAERKLLDRLERAREALAKPADTVDAVVEAALAASNKIPAATRNSPEFSAAIHTAVDTFLADAEPQIDALQRAVDALGLPPAKVSKIVTQLTAAQKFLDQARKDGALAGDRLRAADAVYDRIALGNARLNRLLSQMANADCEVPYRLGMSQRGSAKVTVTGRDTPVVIAGPVSGDGLGDSGSGDFNGSLSQAGRGISFQFQNRAFAAGTAPWAQFSAEFTLSENGTNYRATGGSFQITTLRNRAYQRTEPGQALKNYVTISATFTGTVQNTGNPADTLQISAEFRVCEIPYYQIP